MSELVYQEHQEQERIRLRDELAIERYLQEQRAKRMAEKETR